jgi:hypothetical protein
MTVTVKGVPASASQLAVIDGALGEAHGLGAGNLTMIGVVMTMTQESVCESINYGDEAGPDSRGPFQQRDPWGPLSVRMSPSGSCRLFLLGGLTGEDGWRAYWSIPDGPPPGVSLEDAIVRVQVSVGGYAPWQPEATNTVNWWLSQLDPYHLDWYDTTPLHGFGDDRHLVFTELSSVEQYDVWRRDPKKYASELQELRPRLVALRKRCYVNAVIAGSRRRPGYGIRHLGFRWQQINRRIEGQLVIP